VPADADSLAALGQLASTAARSETAAPPVAADEQLTVAVARPPRGISARVASIPALRDPTSVPAVAALGALPRRTQLAALAGVSVAAGLLAGLVVPVASASPVTTAASPAGSGAGAVTAAAARTTSAAGASTPGRTSGTKAASSKAAATTSASRKAPVAKAATTTPSSTRTTGPAASSVAALTSTLPALAATTGLDWSTAATPARATTARTTRAVTSAGWVREAEPVRPSAATIAAARAYKPTRKLPADSGEGRRIVYAQHKGHVWIVGTDGQVVRDYPVTGRIGRPAPGSYRVFSKSPTAVNPIAKVRFDLMVRFAHGITGAAIGFHTIPRWYDGRPIQRENQLGQMIGAGGCVRQSKADARWLYRWAKVGERVVVLP
jgi:hypothetical protein